MRGRFTVLASVVACVSATAAGAQDMHPHAMAMPMAPAAAPAHFTASSAKPFAQLMTDAMAVMDRDMAAAPMNGQPGHDFVTMMLPHHQGAIDMAKSVLLNTRDPALRNLALGIIAEQQNEINVMRAWLAQHPQQKEQR